MMNEDENNSLYADIESFDIRKGLCSQLMNQDPDIKMPGKTIQQRSLIAQFERDRLLYDISQELDPFENRFRINVFKQDTFELITSAQVSQQELQKELNKDQKRYLFEAQNRGELGKYLIENIVLDKQKNTMFFLKSSLDPPD